MKICKYLAVVVAVVVLYSSQATAEGGKVQVMACMLKLLPCQPYLRTDNPQPPPSCCGPMKEIVEKDAPCVCSVFNNPEMLKTLNLTKENALDLPKACGAKPDVSLCTTPSPSGSPGSTNGSSPAPTVSFIGLISFLFSFMGIFFF